jgi:hypothetical protein
MVLLFGVLASIGAGRAKWMPGTFNGRMSLASGDDATKLEHGPMSSRPARAPAWARNGGRVAPHRRRSIALVQGWSDRPLPAPGGKSRLAPTSPAHHLDNLSWRSHSRSRRALCTDDAKNPFTLGAWAAERDRLQRAAASPTLHRLFVAYLRVRASNPAQTGLSPHPFRFDLFCRPGS